MDVLKPVGQHPGPKLGVHCLISKNSDEIPEADVSHVDEGVVHAVLVRPVILHETEQGGGKQDEHEDSRHSANQHVKEDPLPCFGGFTHK